MRDVGTGAHHARTGIPVRWPGAAARSGAPSTSRTLPGSQRRRLPVTPLEQAGPGLQGRLGFPEPPPRQEGAPRPRDEGNGQAVAARGTRPLGTAQAARASGPRPLRPAVPRRAFLCSAPPASHVSGKLALPFFFLKEAAIFGTRGRRLAPQSRRPPPVPLLRTLVLGGLGGVTRSLPTRAGIPTGWAASGLKGRRGLPPRCLPSLPTLQRSALPYVSGSSCPSFVHSFTHSFTHVLVEHLLSAPESAVTSDRDPPPAVSASAETRLCSRAPPRTF